MALLNKGKIMTEQERLTRNKSAFPTCGYTEGMTLRDYFAAKAMQSLVVTDIANTTDAPLLNVAKAAYAMADAMLIVRNISNGN